MEHLITRSDRLQSFTSVKKIERQEVIVEENKDIKQEEKELEKETETTETEEAQVTGDAEETTEKDADSSDEKAQSEEKGKFFKKKEKKDKKDQAIEELTDKYTRLMAEFDNFRKRTEKEKEAMFEVGAKSVIEKILPVVDSFERGLAATTEEEKKTPFVDGMDKVYKQMIGCLDEIGVKPIEAVGNEFNPEFHNAVMHEENEELGENIVAEEFQKGYTYRDGVVRHSMVKVAN